MFSLVFAVLRCNGFHLFPAEFRIRPHYFFSTDGIKSNLVKRIRPDFLDGNYLSAAESGVYYAVAFLENLREKYGDKYDFFAVGSIEDPRTRSLTGTKAYSVILTNDEIEKMANDEEYAEEVMKKVESAVDMTKRIEEKGELGEGVKFKHISIAFDNDGNMKLFAELEKMSEQQKERMEKAKEKRAEEAEADKKAEKEKKPEHDPHAKSVWLEADTEEELLEKIMGIDWDSIKGKGKA